MASCRERARFQVSALSRILLTQNLAPIRQFSRIPLVAPKLSDVVPFTFPGRISLVATESDENAILKFIQGEKATTNFLKKLLNSWNIFSSLDSIQKAALTSAVGPTLKLQPYNCQLLPIV